MVCVRAYIHNFPESFERGESKVIRTVNLFWYKVWNVNNFHELNCGKYFIKFDVIYWMRWYIYGNSQTVDAKSFENQIEYIAVHLIYNNI